ncbi:MAG: hypothetical protein M1840_002036 [Geoglossum simile]|nr:MAG: hypothetical protein M1840_002036 [Geoglossum simile]
MVVVLAKAKTFVMVEAPAKAELSAFIDVNRWLEAIHKNLVWQWSGGLLPTLPEVKIDEIIYNLYTAPSWSWAL